MSKYMRSVVRTITQVHDKGDAHGAVDARKFMLLSEDRSSTLKATGFGRIGQKTGPPLCASLRAFFQLLCVSRRALFQLLCASVLFCRGAHPRHA